MTTTAYDKYLLGNENGIPLLEERDETYLNDSYRNNVYTSLLNNDLFAAAAMSSTTLPEIHGTSSGEYLYGTSASEAIYGYGGNDTIYGYGGDDVLDGGSSTSLDLLIGGVGNDTYHWDPTQSSVRLFDDDSGTHLGDDVIKIHGVSMDDVRFTLQNANENLEIYFDDNNNYLRVAYQYYTETRGGAFDSRKIERVEFDDGSVMNLDENTMFTYTDGANDVTALSGANHTYYGAGGNDKLRGNTGNDTLLGGAGDDIILGQGGDDVLDGGTSTGADRLIGGTGNDTYHWNPALSKVTMFDDDSATHLGDDVIKLHGVSMDDVRFTLYNGNEDLLINYDNNGNWLRVAYQYYTETRGGAFDSRKIERVEFDDGSVMNLDENTVFTYTDGGDNITALSGSASHIYNGAGGNDTLYANGNDTLIGGSGNDVFYESGGDNTIIISRNDGHDTIYGSRGENNRIVFDDTISPNELWFQKTGNDLTIKILGVDQSITVKSLFDGFYSYGTVQHYIQASNGDIELIGGDRGYHSNLFMAPYPGAYLGRDAYLNHWGVGDGHWVGPQGSNNYLTDAQLLFRANFLSNTSNTGDPNSPKHADPFTYGWQHTSPSGVTLSPSQVGNDTQVDYFSGTTGADTIVLSGGDDYAYGGIGDDTITGSNTFVSSDKIYGDSGDDILSGGAGDDAIYGGLGTDIAVFSGNYEDYTIVDHGSYQTVTDNVGTDGTDTLTDVETLVFANGELTDGVFTSYNTAPVAVDDVFSGNEDTDITSNVLSNDSDPEGDALSVVAGTYATAHGSVVLAADGTFTYTPVANYNGTDNFTYTVTDGALTDTATVTLNVTAVNDAPVAVDDAFSGSEDADITDNVLNNDSDIENDVLSVVAGTYATAHGSVVLAADGTFTYTPVANYNGTDSFTYTVSDGALTDTATVTLNIAAVNDNPVAVDDMITGEEGSAITGNVLVNDTDADNDTLQVVETSVVSAQGITVSLSANGNFTYNAPAGYIRADSFSYTVSDGNGGQDTAVVNLTIEDAIPNIIIGTPNVDNLRGTASIDYIYGRPDDDNIYGEEGDDRLYGETGDDLIIGNTGNDEIYGGSGDDWMTGNDGNDLLDGGTGNDVYQGGGGDDTFIGGAGNDSFNGEAGNDTLQYNISSYGVAIYRENETIYKITGPGIDLDNFAFVETIEFTDITLDVASLNLVAGGEGWGTHYVYGSSLGDNPLEGTPSKDIIYGYGGSDYLRGYLHDDVLYGGAGTDYLSGNEGDDILYGEADNDTLWGHEGDDILYGGSGHDALFGGAGADTFVFESGSAFSERDQVSDFSLSEGDMLDISDILSGYNPVDDAINEFVQVREDNGNYFLAVDSNGGADNFVDVAFLGAVTGLTDAEDLETSGNLITV